MILNVTAAPFLVSFSQLLAIKNTENGAAVTSLRTFVFRYDFTASQVVKVLLGFNFDGILRYKLFLKIQLQCHSSTVLGTVIKCQKGSAVKVLTWEIITLKKVVFLEVNIYALQKILDKIGIKRGILFVKFAN